MDVGTSHQLQRQISVTPMIDVVLVLLVVFMLAMQFFAFIPVNVPPPESAARHRADPQVVLELRADGSYALNGMVVVLSALPGRLRTLYGDGGRRILYVRAAPTRKYWEVIEAVDVAKGAGVPVIGYMP
jgi:biopolymer transport protein ExbD